MPRLLIISFFFPPFGGAGVQRALKFAKYLPYFGWSPVVLTVDARYAQLQDLSLQDELPDNISVERTRAMLLPKWLPWRVRKFLTRWLLLVDEQLGWYPLAIQRARKLLNEGNIHAIYSTSPPFTAHLIGNKLAEMSRLPWIADFRDPWVGNFSLRFPTRVHESIATKIEGRVVRDARRVIVVSEQMRQALLSRNPELDHNQVISLPNGYDQTDFVDIRPFDYPGGKMTIVYTGTFYARVHTPQLFLQALKSSLERNLIPRHQIQVYLVGNIGKTALEMVAEMGLSDIVYTPGYLPHRQSLAYLLGADVLLFIIGNAPGSEAVLTGKIFEYLASRKPILAITPPGAAADLITQAQAGIVIHSNNYGDISDRLVELFHRWQSGELNIQPDNDLIYRFERRNLTGELAAILDGLL